MTPDYDTYPPTRPCPLWMKLLIIILMLPVLTFPFLLSETTADNTARLLVWFYPCYVIVSGICAWMCYPTRAEVTWILLVMMVLTHAGMWVLVNS